MSILDGALLAAIVVVMTGPLTSNEVRGAMDLDVSFLTLLISVR